LNSLLSQVRTFNDELQLEVARATEDLHRRNLALEDTSRQMLSMQRQLLESERLATVGQMAATFAHEIGSPMSSLSAHVQLLLEDSRLPQDQRESLLIVRGQIHAVVQIVNELLRSARRGPSDFVLTDINKILETVIRLVQPKLTSQRIAVQVDLKPVPAMRGYPLYLQEVFLNLINNASEAMPEGGTLEVRSWYDERPGLLNVSIIDSGPGIDPTVVERMFDHFVTTKAIGEGTGLGLAIVKEIVNSHRGTVRIAPLETVGTAAHITFPAESAVRV
jgi:signal transduction histidine kinase